MIHIVTDSTATVLPEMLESHPNLHIIPMMMCIGGQYVPENETTIDKVIEYSEREKKNVATSQPSTGDFLKVFDSIPESDSILVITLTSAVSGTYSGAVLAARQSKRKNIAVIDSHTTAIGMRQMIQDAFEYIDQGMSFDELKEKMSQAALHMRTTFTIPTLDYLRRGGRLGGAAGLIGSILKIKPIIYINSDNKIDALDKVRTEKKAAARMLKYLEDNMPCKRIGVVHIQNLEGAKALQERVREMCPDVEVTISTGTPVLVAYLGPGLTGLIFESLK
jgi:DegV family protein with EDD domain